MLAPKSTILNEHDEINNLIEWMKPYDFRDLWRKFYEKRNTEKSSWENFMKIQKSNAEFNDKSIILFFHEKSKFDKFETTSRRQSFGD